MHAYIATGGDLKCAYLTIVLNLHEVIHIAIVRAHAFNIDISDDYRTILADVAFVRRVAL